MKCPICHKPVARNDPEYPFCSQRCRVADLANWSTGVYRVPVKPTDEAGNDAEIPEGGSDRPQ